MFSIWLVLVYLMVDVMGLGHGGDGAGAPPPPGDGGDDWWHGHQADGKNYRSLMFTVFI